MYSSSMPMNPSIETPAKLRLPAIAPGGHHCHHAKAGKDKHAGLGAEAADAFAASKSRYGYRGIKAALRTGVPEKVTGRIMAEDGPVAHVPRRRGHGSHEGGTNPAPGTPITRDFTAERPNEKRLTDITEIKAADGKVYLSPVIDCHDGKIVAYTAGYGPNVQPADTMPEKAAATLPEGARPRVRSDRGRHHRRPGWLELMERFGLTRSTGAKGRSPDNSAAEGFFGGMRVGSVRPGRWEEHTRGEVLALIDGYTHWCNHDHIKQSLGWVSPVEPAEPWIGCVINSKKNVRTLLPSYGRFLPMAHHIQRCMKRFARVSSTSARAVAARPARSCENHGVDATLMPMTRKSPIFMMLSVNAFSA